MNVSSSATHFLWLTDVAFWSPQNRWDHASYIHLFFFLTKNLLLTQNVYWTTYLKIYNITNDFKRVCSITSHTPGMPHITMTYHLREITQQFLMLFLPLLSALAWQSDEYLRNTQEKVHLDSLKGTHSAQIIKTILFYKDKEMLLCRWTYLAKRLSSYGYIFQIIWLSYRTIL